MVALAWKPKMRRVFGVINHSFGGSRFGVEQTTAAFGGPGKQHETGCATRRRSQNRHMGCDVVLSRDQNRTEPGDVSLSAV
jgi:hypothetical protein